MDDPDDPALSHVALGMVFGIVVTWVLLALTGHLV